MKSLTIKIPLSVAKIMDDKAQLNPVWLSRFIEDFLPHLEVPKQPIQELTFNYTFKIDEFAHKQIKIKAIECDLPMNEMIGRLLANYY